MFEVEIDKPLFFKCKKIMIKYNIYSYFFNEYLRNELSHIKYELSGSLRGTSVNELE
jgi:hypothetical protein